MKYLKILSLSLFFITFLENNVELEFQDKSFENTNFKKDSTYSIVVDSFLKKMKGNYGKSFEKKIWNHHDELKNNLIKKKFNNFIFNDSDNKKIDLKDYKIPTIIIVTASWCAPCESLVPAINELSEKYKKKVKFIMLTHDVGKKAENYSSKFNNNVIVIPSLVKTNSMKPIKLEIGKFKHLFSFPTIYFLNSEKEIIEIQIGAFKPESYFVNGKIDPETLFEDNSKIENSKEKTLINNLNLIKKGLEKIMK
ncbi:thioredoxin family protein [Polaribacter sp. PL03]|uniref:TlpA family protein disulfide reductase n=1 Tax=Polaribacter sp. PL03 TaxID=3088353 RepID=UPI0029CC5549|nr:thioredoxin family protein [Polaribacter sp. PL03]MDX6748064.1 thioredoxin family protein [Polaribacter sp. PL03]